MADTQQRMSLPEHNLWNTLFKDHLLRQGLPVKIQSRTKVRGRTQSQPLKMNVK